MSTPLPDVIVKAAASGLHAASGLQIFCGLKHFKPSVYPRVSICGPKKDDMPDLVYSVKFSFSIHISGPNFPKPPAPLSLSGDVSMANGEVGMMSHGEFDEEGGTEWDIYLGLTKPIEECVLEALPKSSYLGFTPMSDDQLRIEMDATGKVFKVRIDSCSTSGWGVFNSESNEWTDLNHKHKCGNPNGDFKETCLYDGPNTFFS